MTVAGLVSLGRLSRVAGCAWAARGSVWKGEAYDECRCGRHGSDRALMLKLTI